MTRAGFARGADPGAWLSRDGVPVDLMIPESMSDPGGRRGGRVPPHSKRALRRATGLEAAIVDHAPITITALEPTDERTRTINVRPRSAARRQAAQARRSRRQQPGAPQRQRRSRRLPTARLLRHHDTGWYVPATTRRRDLREHDADRACLPRRTLCAGSTRARLADGRPRRRTPRRAGDHRAVNGNPRSGSHQRARPATGVLTVQAVPSSADSGPRTKRTWRLPPRPQPAGNHTDLRGTPPSGRLSKPADLQDFSSTRTNPIESLKIRNACKWRIFGFWPT